MVPVPLQVGQTPDPEQLKQVSCPGLVPVPPQNGHFPVPLQVLQVIGIASSYWVQELIVNPVEVPANSHLTSPDFKSGPQTLLF